jgi:tRNA pseudouridine38-40 synthase
MHPDFKMVALWCWYRGAGFHGFQHVEGKRTVQSALLEAFAKAGLPRNPVASARTDIGVSARMQVLSARVEVGRPLEDLHARLSAALPADLRLHLAKTVPAGFHAAWSATGKEYRYALPADVLAGAPRERLQEAMALVPGTRDFRVFHHKASQGGPRTVRAVEWLEPPPGADDKSVTGAALRFTGEKFGRHMVRMLTGALLAVAREEVALEVLRAGLEAQEKFHCPVAPAEALLLWSVEYPAADDPFTAAERAAFGWPPA